jgi:hypothetical protein
MIVDKYVDIYNRLWTIINPVNLPVRRFLLRRMQQNMMRDENFTAHIFFILLRTRDEFDKK